MKLHLAFYTSIFTTIVCAGCAAQQLPGALLQVGSVAAPPPPPSLAAPVGLPDTGPTVTRTSRVRSFDVDPSGTIHSMYLRNGEVVDVPPGLAAQLGPGVQKGSRIAVTGNTFTADGQRVIAASNITVGGRTVVEPTPVAPVPPDAAGLDDRPLAARGPVGPERGPRPERAPGPGRAQGGPGALASGPMATCAPPPPIGGPAGAQPLPVPCGPAAPVPPPAGVPNP